LQTTPCSLLVATKIVTMKEDHYATENAEIAIQRRSGIR